MNHRIFSSCIPFFARNFSTIFLAFCWCTGVLAGCFLSQQMDNIHFSLMREAANCSVSIVGLFAVVLPFLISAIAAYTFQTWLLFPVCFLKAFSFAFVASSVTQAFGASGWLIRILLLFTDFCSAPILLFGWFRLVRRPVKNSLQECAVCAAICFVICCLDYYIVSPFLIGLI